MSCKVCASKNQRMFARKIALHRGELFDADLSQVNKANESRDMLWTLAVTSIDEIRFSMTAYRHNQA